MTDDFRKKLDYELPLTQADIAYYVINAKEYKPQSLQEPDYDDLYKSIIEVAQNEVAKKFAVEFQDYQPELVFDNQKINYFLIALVDPTLIDDKFKNLLTHLKSAPNSKVNIATIYSSENSSRASQDIMELDKELGVNTIFQDTEVAVGSDNFMTISHIDAADNIVCETFRIKYKAVHRQDEQAEKMLSEARDEVRSDVQKMQAIYTRYHLWHRSPIDGAFMFRTRHGWLTTATHTPKDNVQIEDLSLILDFDEKTDTVTYVGNRLPSSDLPEFLVLVERNEAELARQGEQTPVIRYVAHFHKNEFTRNPKLMEYAVPFSRYGVFESGHKFADELYQNKKAERGINISGKGRGFIILEHGLVRMGVELRHLGEFLEELATK